MSALNALTPRVFLFRHGETEWARSGRSTGTTDIELNPAGVAQVSLAASMLVGSGRLLDPICLRRIFVSPRKRARQTFELLLGPNAHELFEKKLTYTEDIAEWDYGHYEGLTNPQIRALRQQKGQDKEREWDIWRDGCEGGESAEQITERLNRLISEIREIQQPHMHGEEPADVLLVAHGLILRCFTKRWIGLSIDDPFPIMLEPGAISVLSYKNNDVTKPALHSGLALPFGEDTQRRIGEVPKIPIAPPQMSGACEVNKDVVEDAHI